MGKKIQDAVVVAQAKTTQNFVGLGASPDLEDLKRKLLRVAACRAQLMVLDEWVKELPLSGKLHERHALAQQALTDAKGALGSPVQPPDAPSRHLGWSREGGDLPVRWMLPEAEEFELQQQIKWAVARAQAAKILENAATMTSLRSEMTRALMQVAAKQAELRVLGLWRSRDLRDTRLFARCGILQDDLNSALQDLEWAKTEPPDEANPPEAPGKVQTSKSAQEAPGAVDPSEPLTVQIAKLESQISTAMIELEAMERTREGLNQKILELRGGGGAFRSSGELPIKLQELAEVTPQIKRKTTEIEALRARQQEMVAKKREAEMPWWKNLWKH